MQTGTEPPKPKSMVRLRLFGLVAGPLVASLMLAIPPPEVLDPAAWRVAALAALMAVWWLSEAIPIPATALLPAILLPLLGVMDLSEAVAPYANPIIFLFLGGFVVALTIERWGLHRRIAILIISSMAARADKLIGGFMLATAGLSMWVSNTATTMMMLPVALGVIALIESGEGSKAEARALSEFPRALLLGIAYGASIGGLATLIGTPPNAFLAGFMAQSYGVEIGFFQWMVFGVPLSATMLLVAWLLLTRILYRSHRLELAFLEPEIARQRASLGPLGRGEKLSAGLILSVAGAWIFRPLIDDWVAITDTTIALIGALAAFAIPVHPRRLVFLMDWSHAKRLPWGILILFGGGLSLARGIDQSGLADSLGAALSSGGTWPLVVFLLVLTALVVFLTELTSNTATAAVLVPVAASMGTALGYDPLTFALPVALAASCAFMMPVATPPNAIVFSAGRLTVPQMCRAGLFVNAAAILIIALWSLTLQPWVF